MTQTTQERRTATTIEEFNAVWPQLAADVARAFSLSAKQTESLSQKPIARLIAAIPFAAGCRTPHRTAVAHLGTYLLSIRGTKHYFNATHEDDKDVFERLRLISSFTGGDERVIRKGMALLALNMLNDYRRDVEVDRCLGKHNPLSSGAMRYGALKEELDRRAASVASPIIDTIVAESNGSVTEGYWWID